MKNKRLGATAVEFAVALPVLVLLIFGGIEVTRIGMLRHTANHAAYVASRDAIIPGVNVADVIKTAEDHLAVIGVHDAVVTVSPSSITEDTQSVSVTVTFPVSSNSLVVPQFLSGDVVGQSALMTERSGSQMSANMLAPPPPESRPPDQLPAPSSAPKPPPPPPPML